MLSLLLALQLAAVPTVTVSGKVLTPNGSPPVRGTILCRLTTPGSALDGSTLQRVAGEVKATLSAAGTVSLALVPNDAITPPGTRYTCAYDARLASGRQAYWSEQWQLASSPAAQDIGSVPVPTYPLGATMPAAAPTFLPASGAVDRLTLSANTPNSIIYYSTDGSTPTTSSTIYSAPFVPENTGSFVTVKGVAAPLLGWSLSGVTSTTYSDPRVTWGLELTPGCYPTATALGTNGSAGTFARATTAIGTISGVETTCASGQFRMVDGGGYLSEKLATQYMLNNCTAPATGTVTLPTGWHTAWVEGTGSLALAVGTATATGLPCTASGGTACSFNVTVGGTVVGTVSGSLTRHFVQTGEGKTSPICCTGASCARNAELLTVPNPITLTDDWCWGVTVQPAYGRDWFASTTSYLGMGTNAGANSARIFSSTSQYIQADIYDGTPAAVSAQIFPFQTAPTPPHPRFNGLPDFSADGSEHRFVMCQRANGRPTLHIDGKVMPVTYSATAGTGKLASMPATIGIGSTISAANNLNANGIVSQAQIAATTSPVILGGSPTWLGKGVTCIGDSITSGNAAGVDTAWPTRLQQLLGSEWMTINQGTSGYTANQILAIWNSSDYLRRFQYVAVLAGTNSLATQTSAQIMADLTEIYVDAQAEGITPIAITLLPRTGTAGQLTTLLEVNTLIRAYAAAHPGVLLVDAYPSFDNGSGQLQAQYDSGDGLHPNQAGTDLIAILVRAALP